MTEGMDSADRDRVARRAALQRLVTPADVAESVLYLMSEAGRNVTGAVLTVDAGATA
jgi:3-oxoacyl-[acyl-carrier protein] reductase